MVLEEFRAHDKTANRESVSASGSSCGPGSGTTPRNFNSGSATYWLCDAGKTKPLSPNTWFICKVKDDSKRKYLIVLLGVLNTIMNVKHLAQSLACN